MFHKNSNNIYEFYFLFSNKDSRDKIEKMDKNI